MIPTSSLCLAFITALTVLCSCQSQNQNNFTCDNIVCDTIDTFLVQQFCSDTTIDYDLTYDDTIRMVRTDGELVFSIQQCRNCTGKLNVPVVNRKNEAVDTVSVNYSGDGISDRFTVASLLKSDNEILRVDWKTGGKVFYLKAR